MNGRLGRFLDRTGQTAEEQAGFRRGYSTIDQIFILDTVIQDVLKTKKKKLYACFIDFKKAFDSVPRAALWYKMHRCGIKGNFLRILMDMYTKCSFAVRINETTATKYSPTSSGVFQGCLLSPTLFRIFINDIIQKCAGVANAALPHLRRTPIVGLLFADDLVLLSETPEGLQNLIDSVEEYANYWGLQVNVDKTKCMVFRRGGRLARSENWTYGGSNIEVVSKFKYLGVHFTCCHTWANHISIAMTRGKKVTLMLNRLMYGYGTLPLNRLFYIYDLCVAPTVLYGAEVWGMWAKPVVVDSVDTMFLRRCLGLPKGTPSAPLLLETNRTVSLYWKAKERAMLYWLRVSLLPNTRLVKQAYIRQRELSDAGVDCIGQRIKSYFNYFENTQDLSPLWNTKLYQLQSSKSCYKKCHTCPSQR